jgi:hypothetical protein
VEYNSKLVVGMSAVYADSNVAIQVLEIVLKFLYILMRVINMHM